VRKLILLILCFPVGALPQPVSPANTAEQATVAALLSSSDPAQLAWGAELAANYQQKTFVPAIISLLDFGNADVQLCAFDALIRLNADVTEKTLARFLSNPDALEPIIVLLARDPKAHAAFLMRALDQPLSDRHWVDVNSFLAATPPPSYTARLLRDWTIKDAVLVREDGPGSGADVGYACGGVLGPPRPGFPVIPRYNIYEGPHPGATLIASGPHSIFYMRENGTGDCRVGVPRDRYRLDYLRYMARIDAQSPEGRRPSAPVIRWAGPEDYVSKASAYLTSLRVFVTNLRSQLVHAGVLTESDSLNGPSLEIEVQDRRDDRTIPLPIIDWHL
jgi:hypothetical protein